MILNTLLKFSYFSRTIREWNGLPSEIVSAESLNSFKENLGNNFILVLPQFCTIIFTISKVIIYIFFITGIFLYLFIILLVLFIL